MEGTPEVLLEPLEEELTEQVPLLTDGVLIDPAEMRLTASVWRREWDKLDSIKKKAAKCRAGCNHAESAHTFSTTTMDDCVHNCRVCAGKVEE
jgi:hypothetical protein